MAPKVGSRFIPMGAFGRFVFIPLSLLSFDGVSATCKLLWGIIALLLGKDGKAYPTRAYLAKRMGITKRSVSRAAKQLVDAGFLEMESGIGRTPTHYHLLFHDIFLKDPDLRIEKIASPPGVDIDVHSHSSRVDADVHSQASKRGHVVPLRVDTNVNQKRISSKNHKEKKKIVDSRLTPEQNELLKKQVALSVYNQNLSQDAAAQLRTQMSEEIRSKPVDLLISSVRCEYAAVERRIEQIPWAKAREDALKHLHEGSLMKRSLEGFPTTRQEKGCKHEQEEIAN